MQIDNELDTGAAGAADDGNDTDTGAPAADTEPTTTADAVARALAGDDDEVSAAPDDTRDDGEEDGAPKPEGEDDDQGADDKPAEDELKTPEGLSTGAKERFEKLVDRVRTTAQERDQIAQERDEVRGQYETVVQVMKDTGAPPEQFAQTLVMLGYANSGDPAKVAQALDMLDGYRAELAKKVGKPVPGVDVLGDFPDLKAKVEAGDLDEATAAELATARRDRVTRDKQSAETKERESAQGQMAERVTKAQADLTTLGTTLKAKDPDFTRKLDILGKRGFFERVSQTAPPEQWGELFTIAYEALGDVAAARTPAPKPGNQPMRSTPEGGGGSPKPKTTADAVRLALSEE